MTISIIDINLLAGLKSGNRKAFEKIYNKNWEKLFLFIYSNLGDVADAEEVVQEVFISLWEKRSELRVHSSLETYLFKMGKNKMLNHIRAVKNRCKYYNDFQKFYQSQDCIELDMKLDAEQLTVYIEDCIEELPPRCKEIFKLNRFEDFSNFEIAKKLNISNKTVENQMTKALKFLRNRLNRFKESNSFTGPTIQ